MKCCFLFASSIATLAASMYIMPFLCHSRNSLRFFIFFFFSTDHHLAILSFFRALPEPHRRSTKSCTTTVIKFAEFNLSPFESAFLTTVTTTASLDCGGCSELRFVFLRGPGPVYFFFSFLAFLISLSNHLFFALVRFPPILLAQSNTVLPPTHKAKNTTANANQLHQVRPETATITNHLTTTTTTVCSVTPTPYCNKRAHQSTSTKSHTPMTSQSLSILG